MPAQSQFQADIRWAINILSNCIGTQILLTVLLGQAVQPSADIDNLTVGNRPFDQAVPSILTCREECCHILAGKDTIPQYKEIDKRELNTNETLQFLRKESFNTNRLCAVV